MTSKTRETPVANTPYPIDPVLSAISIAYRNEAYIADQVLPRTPVGREEFKYITYPVEETMRLPDTRVGRRGKVNEVVLTGEERIASTGDYALDDPIPRPDIDQAQGAGLPDPVGDATMQLTDYLMIDREVRTAGLVFDAAQYPTDNKIQLSTTDQWNEYAEANSDPIQDILTGVDAALLKPTSMVMGAAVWRYLRAHPKIVAAIHGNDGTVGIVTRQQVATLFELKEVLIGEQRLNTAKYGQAAVLSRVWGNHCLLFRKDQNASTQRGVTFGFTAEYKTRVVGQIDDPDIGMRGGTRVRVGESVKELISAPLVAYLIEDAI
jgi:hypothetical protein